MTFLRAFALLSFALSIGGIGPARAAVTSDHPAQGLVHAATSAVFDALLSDPNLKTERERLIALVEEQVLPHFDFTLMAKRVLGTSWRRANEGQRDAFVEQFQVLLVRTYTASLLSYAGQTVSFLATRERPDGKQVMVRTAIDAGNTVPVSVDYAMYRDGSRWKVYDVTIEGVSLVVTYRSSYRAAIRENGIDGLIGRLRAKNRGG